MYLGEHDWIDTVKILENRFEEDLNLEDILFHVGVQELRKGYLDFSSSEKLKLLQVATATLLSDYDHYEYIGFDDDDWPVFRKKESLSYLSKADQINQLKNAIIIYFEN
ncbi:MAG: hypothetical protein HRT71_19965 [Flavobacteriales bacterium]|nr:hypothetical protein [Flavobacteriales bacterium]